MDRQARVIEGFMARDQDQTSRALDAMQAFLTTPLAALLQQDSAAAVEEELLAHFRAVASSVPAYQDFLHEHGVDVATIRTLDDLRRLPLTTKENYLRRYSLDQLCRDGMLERCDMIAVSSG